MVRATTSSTMIVRGFLLDGGCYINYPYPLLTRGWALLRLVLFDVWNTLLRLDVVYEEIARVASAVLGIEFSEALARLRAAYAESRRARRLGLVGPENVVDRSTKLFADLLGVEDFMAASIIERALRSVKPSVLAVDGALDVVRAVKGLGLKVATLGNVLFWPGMYTKDVVKAVGLSTYIDRQFYADELGVQKPDREAFLAVCRELSVEPEEALHVGDGVSEDLGGALSAGLKAVLITGDVDRPVSIGSDIHFIPRLTHVVDIVKGLMVETA